MPPSTALQRRFLPRRSQGRGSGGSVSVREFHVQAATPVFRVTPSGLVVLIAAPPSLLLPEPRFLRNHLGVLEGLGELQDLAETPPPALVLLQSGLETLQETWTAAQERRLRRLMEAGAFPWYFAFDRLGPGADTGLAASAAALARSLGVRVTVLSEDVRLHAEVEAQGGRLQAASLRPFLERFGHLNAAQRATLEDLRRIEEPRTARRGEAATMSIGGSLANLSPHPGLPPAPLDAALRSQHLFRGKLEAQAQDAHTGFVKASLQSRAGVGMRQRLEHEFRFPLPPAQRHFQLYVPSEAAMNRSISGDEVAFELLPRSMWAAVEASAAGTGGPPAGLVPAVRVVAVLERERQHAVVTLLESGGGGGLATPWDVRLPKLRLRSSQSRALVGKRLWVRLEAWAPGSGAVEARYLRVLGPVGDGRTEVLCLLLEHGMRLEPFSPAALAELPAAPRPPEEPQIEMLGKAAAFGFGPGLGGGGPGWHDSEWRVDEAEAARRRDLRSSHLVFSIDPVGCQDIDDAMSVRELGGGRIEVGVHIADVSYFVGPESALDLAARRRGETLYLPHSRFDMLPKLLSGDVCSLQGQRTRYAVSVFWEVSGITAFLEGHRDAHPERNEEALPTEVTIHAERTWFGRTVLRNDAAMTYGQARALLFEGSRSHPEGKGAATVLDPQPPPPPGQAGAPVASARRPALRRSVALLTLFARFLKEERRQAGSLDLSADGREVDFEIQAAAVRPDALREAEHMETHSTVEELMVFANSSVARKIYASSPGGYGDTVLRSHVPTAVAEVEGVLGVLEGVGLGTVATLREEAKQRVEGRKTESAVLMQLAIHRVRKAPGLAEKQRAHLLGFLKSSMVSVVTEAQYRVAARQEGEALGEGRLGHFGLGLAFYTHFTSPIRRYADVLVHRQLLQSLSGTLPDANGSSRPRTRIRMVPGESEAPASGLDDALDAFLTQVDDGVGHGLGAADAEAWEPSPVAAEEGHRLAGADSVALNFHLNLDLDLDDLLEAEEDVEREGKAKPREPTKVTKPAKPNGPPARAASPPLDLDLDDLLGDGPLPAAAPASTWAGALAGALQKEAQDPLPVAEGLPDPAGETSLSAPVSLTAPPPATSGASISALCDHVNVRHRQCRIASMACSRLFLGLYLAEHPTPTDGLVTGIFRQGARVYVAQFDLTMPLYFCDKHDVAHLPVDIAPPSADAGPPQQGFDAYDKMRSFPGLQWRPLVDEASVVDTQGNEVLRLERMDVVKVLLSCDVGADRARVPPPRAHFLGLRTAGSMAPKPKAAKHAPRKDKRWKAAVEASKPAKNAAEVGDLYDAWKGRLEDAKLQVGAVEASGAAFAWSMPSADLRRVRKVKQHLTEDAVDREERGRGRLVFGGFQPVEDEAAPGEEDADEGHEYGVAYNNASDVDPMAGSVGVGTNGGEHVALDSSVQRFSRQNDKLAKDAMRRSSKLKAKRQRY